MNAEDNKRPAGRPKTGDKRKVAINVTLEPSVIAAIGRAAELQGLTRSSWINQQIKRLLGIKK